MKEGATVSVGVEIDGDARSRLTKARDCSASFTLCRAFPAAR